jgi:arylsulfatase A-like enzyme
MADRPNFLFILTDDQGPWALNCAGTAELATPNLDRLATRGVRFDNFFCASPVCSPARASILTGKIPSAHGVHDWIRSGNVDKDKMDRLGLVNPYGGYGDEHKPIQYLAGQRTYTDALVEQGYACALSGKWHLGDSMTPQHGFGSWYTIGKGGAYYYHPDIIENGTIRIENAYVTDLITDKALVFLDELAGQDRPFYLGVHYTAPHSPWEKEQHPPAYIDQYQDCPFAGIPDVPDHPNSTTGPVYGTDKRQSNLRGYFAAITAMDTNVGRLLDTLEARGLWEQTVVVFLSDNGMCMGHHGIWGKGNGTFPQNMYEESVKVPFILSYPPVTGEGGRITSCLASALDLYPTLLGLAGIQDPQTSVLPGRSLVPELAGNPDNPAGERPVVICEEYGPVRMLRTTRFKYIHRYPYGPHELYDLDNDPGEEHNLISLPQWRETIVKMRHELDLWYRQYVNPDVDGAKEAVTGLGQLCRAGLFADRSETYKTVRYKEN